MVTADIFNKVSINAATTNLTGSSFDTSRLTRKTVFTEVNATAGSVTLVIEHSPDDTNWFELDSTTYIGVVASNDYSWDFNSPYTRVSTGGVTGTVVAKAFVTGRGI